MPPTRPGGPARRPGHSAVCGLGGPWPPFSGSRGGNRVAPSGASCVRPGRWPGAGRPGPWPPLPRRALPPRAPRPPLGPLSLRSPRPGFGRPSGRGSAPPLGSAAVAALPAIVPPLAPRARRPSAPPSAASALRSGPCGGWRAAPFPGPPLGPAPRLASPRPGPPSPSAVRAAGSGSASAAFGPRLSRPGGGGPCGAVFPLPPRGVSAKFAKTGTPQNTPIPSSSTPSRTSNLWDISCSPRA